MPPVGLVQRVEELGDLELALLLSFIANEHCLIETEEGALDSLEQELQLVIETTLDEFIYGLLLDSAATKHSAYSGDADDGDQIETTGHIQPPGSDQHTANATSPSQTGSPEPRIANVVIIKNLNMASYDIQIQALENDHIFLSHYHDLEDGFPNLETASDWIEDDRSSSSSVIRKSATPRPMEGLGITFSEADIQHLIYESKKVTITAEVECYLHNIVTFLRMHRAVDGGMNTRPTKYFRALVTCLAPLHGLDYVTPSLVAIAARKIYPHRLILTIPERDRSLQYGSDLAAVTAALQGVTPESVIEDVLAAVETPL
ncbi:MAG: hypothetical protein Q9186_000223 [Xanthomendoza sp. 1 TL-2023]